MIRAFSTVVDDTRRVVVALEEAPTLVVEEAHPTLATIRPTVLIITYAREAREPWAVDAIEVRGVHLCESDAGEWVDTELTARETFYRPSDRWAHFYLDALPVWVHDVARTWLPPATVVPLSHTAAGPA